MPASASEPVQANYHDRQPVILDRENWATWLDWKADAAPLLTGSPPASIVVELAPPELKT